MGGSRSANKENYFLIRPARAAHGRSLRSEQSTRAALLHSAKAVCAFFDVVRSTPNARPSHASLTRQSEVKIIVPERIKLSRDNIFASMSVNWKAVDALFMSKLLDELLKGVKNLRNVDSIY